MEWALHVERLSKGETVSFRPKGNSMTGRIESGQLVTVSPCTSPKVDDIVLCKVNGNFYVHLVKQVGDRGFLIGNNKGKINGWTKQVFGKVIQVEP